MVLTQQHEFLQFHESASIYKKIYIYRQIDLENDAKDFFYPFKKWNPKHKDKLPTYHCRGAGRISIEKDKTICVRFKQVSSYKSIGNMYYITFDLRSYITRIHFFILFEQSTRTYTSKVKRHKNSNIETLVFPKITGHHGK